MSNLSKEFFTQVMIRENSLASRGIFQEPGGCRFCGRIENAHGMFYWPNVGVHIWTEPTALQRQNRMKANAEARLEGPNKPVEEDTQPIETLDSMVEKALSGRKDVLVKRREFPEVYRKSYSFLNGQQDSATKTRFLYTGDVVTAPTRPREGRPMTKQEITKAFDN